ncbi:MAG TPA: GAF domain-containing sensor histidine kinase [Nocardioidaceae bacterium]|nr:GAF domain-containing sensor histidine kinase [Nocardioidaceae bacterium]
MRTKGLVWLLAALGPVLLAVWLTIPDRTPARGHDWVGEVYPNIVMGALLPLLGALILSRLPRHPVGWLFLGCGLVSAFTLAVYAYAAYGLVEHPGSLPLALGAGWVSAWVWSLGFMPLAGLGPLLFPDGRLPSRRWRPLLWVAIAGPLLVVLANAFRPGPLENHPVRDNPLGLALPAPVFSILGAAGLGLFLVGFLGSVAAALVRWRRARDVEREQLRWFALSVALLAVAVIPPYPSWLAVPLAIVVTPMFPIAIAVAILRDKLYGIEVVVRRSLVYGTLTVVLLVGYAVVVSLLGLAVQGHAGSGVRLAATALVAIGFAPVRTRLQRSADRLVYGGRGDPYAVLTDVGRRLDVTEDADSEVLDEVAEAVAMSLRLPYVRVEVHRSGKVEDPMTAEWGARREPLHEVSLSFRGQRVGALFAAARTGQRRLSSAELRLLEDLGRQVGVAAHAMLLSRDLQRSREGIVATREEERRRIRRDLHDGLGPALAGVALGLDAVGRLVPVSPDEAVRLASGLKEEVQAGIADVRRLVEDLRPPALDQLGLVGALEQHAARLTERDPGLSVRVEASGVPALPAAVEVAAYRIATEALNNVARHAAARQCLVRLALEDGRILAVRVEDDGIGFTAPARLGIGLPAMRERALELGGSCETGPGLSGGTRVAARLPLGAT